MSPIEEEKSISLNDTHKKKSNFDKSGGCDGQSRVECDLTRPSETIRKERFLFSRLSLWVHLYYLVTVTLFEPFGSKFFLYVICKHTSVFMISQ